MGRPQVALRRDHSDHVLAVGRHETTSVASRRHGWLLARPPRHGFVAPFSALPLGQAPTGLALPVVKVLADGTYLSVLINPKIRGARHRAAILAAAPRLADKGAGADTDTDTDADAGVELDPTEAHLVRVVEYDVPDRAGNGTGELIVLLSSVLDPADAGADELAVAYHQRWGAT